MRQLKSFFTYSVGKLISAGIPFFLLPVLTAYLTPEDYGILRLFSIYSIILVPFISLMAPSLLSVELFTRQSKGFSRLMSSIWPVPFVMGGLFLLLTVIFKDTLSNWLELDAEWLFLIPLIALLTVIVETFMKMLVDLKKPIPFVTLSVSRTLVELGLTLFLVTILLWNWQGRVMAWMFVLAVMSVIGIIYMRRNGWLSESFDKGDLRMALAFGLPLIPHVIGRFVINQSDLIFVSKMISVEATGIYGIGYQIGFVISVASGAFLNVFAPFMNERLANISERKKEEIVRMSWLYILGIGALSILVSLSAPLIFEYMLDERYAEGSRYVPWIALAYFFWGGYSVFARYIFFLKKTRIMSYLAIFNVSCNLILNFIFIKQFGAIGAAYATTISFFLVFVGVSVVSNRLYPMPWFYFIKK